MNSNAAKPSNACGSVNPKTMIHLVVGRQMVGKDKEKIFEIFALGLRQLAAALGTQPCCGPPPQVQPGASKLATESGSKLPQSMARHTFFFACCSSRIPPMNNRTAAMQMHESATLNAGHQPPLPGTSLS